MKKFKELFITFLLLAGACFLGMCFRSLHWNETNIILIYILAVLMTSRVTKGYLYGILSSIAATFLFNYFFTQPYYTLSVYDSKYLVTFFIMTLTAIITSASTSRIQQSTRLAQENADNMKTLYKLTNQLSDTLEYQELSKVVIKVFSKVFNCPIGCVYFQDDCHYIYYQGKDEDIVQRNIENINDYYSQFNDLNSTYMQIQQECHYPIYGIQKTLGVLIVPLEIVNHMQESKHKLFISMIESVSLAFDHVYAIQEQLRLKEATVKERYRSNLLRAISHDLRTPLSGIMGTSEIIMDMNKQGNESFQLAKGIYEEANWLYLLVENILSLTKVQEGQLVIHKQVEALEEIIGSAIYHMTKNQDYHIEVNVPTEVLMVPMDAKLIEQVIINLLDNAFKQVQDGKVCIYAYKENDYACLEVEDYGQGFKEQDPQRLFEMFYTNNGAMMPDGSKGVGLGLTICKAIVEAHGGMILAKNCLEHHGAKFIVKLPLEEKQ